MWEIQDVRVDVDGDVFVACGVDSGVWTIGELGVVLSESRCDAVRIGNVREERKGWEGERGTLERWVGIEWRFGETIRGRVVASRCL
jgi:hypothetical protein